MSTMEGQLKHPFTCLIAGPTGCGKTHFVLQLIKCNIIDPQPVRIIWCYGEYQDFHRHYPQIEFVEGLHFDTDPTQPTLLIIDDLMQETDERVTKLFTKGSHHRNISVLYLVQNLFGKNKEHRTISLNAHYMVIFKNPRDGSQITHLAKQMYPDNVKYVKEAFADATLQPHGYLFVDLKQDTPDNLRLRTNIFDRQQIVYVPNK